MWRRLLPGLLLLVSAAFLATPARAQAFEITPYYGYRVGGNFSDFSDSGVDELEIKDGEAWGIILTFNLNPNAQVEFLYSQQSSTLRGSGFLFTPANEDLFDLNVENWQVGGTYTGGTPQDPVRGFVGFSLGLTNFEPEDRGFEGDSDFAFSFYGGGKFALAKHVGLRLQGQWVSTYVGSNDEVFCDPFGFCFVVQDATYLNQFEFAAGITFKF
jgi:outer membrane protein with beta-barrel domain